MWIRLNNVGRYCYGRSIWDEPVEIYFPTRGKQRWMSHSGEALISVVLGCDRGCIGGRFPSSLVFLPSPELEMLPSVQSEGHRETDSRHWGQLKDFERQTDRQIWWWRKRFWMLTSHQSTFRKSRSCPLLLRRPPMKTRSSGSFEFPLMRSASRASRYLYQAALSPLCAARYVIWASVSVSRAKM